MAQETPAKVLALFALTLIPYSLLSPFSGVLVDRMPRRTLLSVTNLVRGVLLIALAGIFPTGEPLLYAVLLLVLGFGRLCLTTKGALLPVVAPKGDLLRANSVSAGGGMVAALAGATAGIGMISLTGDEVAFIAAGAVYLVAGAAATRLSAPYAHTQEHPQAWRQAVALVVADMVAGVRAVGSSRAARSALSAIGLIRTTAMFVAVAAILQIKAESSTSDGRLSASALALASAGVGAFVGALTSTPIGRRIGSRGLVILGFGMTGGTMVVLATVPGTASLLALTAATGFGTLVAKVAVDGTLQATLADVLRGRGFALYDTVYNLAGVVAAALMVVLHPALGFRPAVVVVGGMSLATGIAMSSRLSDASDAGRS